MMSNNNTFIFSKLCLILTFILLLESEIVAQNDYKPGYIIDLKGDTIYGKIENQSSFNLSEFCIFLENKSTTPKKILPTSIQSYRFIDGKYFVSKNIQIDNNPKAVFLEYLINGFANLYYLDDKHSNSHFYIETSRDGLVELKNSQVYNDEIFKQSIKEKKEYIGTLNYLFKDMPNISSKLNKLSFDYESLIDITRNYHDFKCKEQKCTIYRKNTQLDFYIGPVVGASLSSIELKSKDKLFDFLNFEKFDKSTSISFGGIFTIKNIFSFGERLIFNCQLMYDYSSYTSQNYNIKIKKIDAPIYFSYIKPNKKWSPYFNIGINNSFFVSRFVNSEFNQTSVDNLNYAIAYYQLNLLLGIGVEYNYKDKSFLFANANFEYGTGINKPGHIDLNYLSSTNTLYKMNIGIRYRINTKKVDTNPSI